MIAQWVPRLRRIGWYLFKLPLMLILILFGFLLDFLCGWPFDLLCRLDRRRGAAGRPSRRV